MLYRRGKIWWVRFTTPDGRRVRRSAKTQSKSEAQEYETKLRAEYYKVVRLGHRPDYSWFEATLKYLAEKQDKTTLDCDKMHIEHFTRLLGGDTSLIDITREKIISISNVRKAENARYSDEPVSVATVNRMLEIVRAILRSAVSWQWIDSAPEVVMLREDRIRERYLTKEEAARLIRELPEHMKLPVELALVTGFRESVIVQLRWGMVDVHRLIIHIPAKLMKTRKPLVVPITMQIGKKLDELRKKRESDRVFLYKGHPVTKFNTKAWRKALVRAGIKNFRFHDLRHTWASWHVQAGTPLHVLQVLGGWSNYSTVLRYAHLDTRTLVSHVEGLAVSFDTDLAQSEKPNLKLVVSP